MVYIGALRVNDIVVAHCVWCATGKYPQCSAPIFKCATGSCATYSYFSGSGECDLVVLVVPPAIAWEVSRMLKITSQAGATIPLRHGEFCEYRVHMEWF
jgi:hypothetical protein